MSMHVSSPARSSPGRPPAAPRPPSTRYDANETLTLVLREPTGSAVLGPQRRTIVTITDNDWNKASPRDTVAVGSGILAGEAGVVSTLNVYSRAPSGRAAFPTDRRDLYTVELWDRRSEWDGAEAWGRQGDKEHHTNMPDTGDVNERVYDGLPPFPGGGGGAFAVPRSGGHLIDYELDVRHPDLAYSGQLMPDLENEVGAGWGRHDTMGAESKPRNMFL